MVNFDVIRGCLIWNIPRSPFLHFSRLNHTNLYHLCTGSSPIRGPEVKWLLFSSITCSQSPCFWRTAHFLYLLNIICLAIHFQGFDLVMHKHASTHACMRPYIHACLRPYIHLTHARTNTHTHTHT